METIYKHLQAQAEALHQIKDNGRVAISLDAIKNMSMSGSVTGAGVNAISPEGLGYIPIAPSFSSRILDLFPKVSVSSQSIVIAKEINVDGVATAVSEGAAKPLEDNDYLSSVPTMRKFAVRSKVSMEMLGDITFVEDAIRSRLLTRLKNKISNDFIAAIMAATPTLTSAGLTAGTGSTGKLKDILPAVYEDLLLSNGHAPNLWLLNRPNYAKLFNEASVNLLWYGLNNPIILPCSQVNALNIAGLDVNMFPLYIYKDMEVSFGLEGDDFTKNIVTMVAEARVAWSLAGEPLKALYNDSITSTLTAIA